MDTGLGSRAQYAEPPPGLGSPKRLVIAAGTPDERQYVFYDRLEIGRDDGRAAPRPGQLLLTDPTVSRSHCVITSDGDGRCFLRDVSRNGTRVDGRRLVPNVEVELRGGQTISVGDSVFVVLFEPRAAQPQSYEGTVGVASSAFVTVLVGDIRDYTVLVRRADAQQVQQSVATVFRLLTEAVTAHGGTVKEFQGDALVAFWEGSVLGHQAVAACRAALHVDTLARTLAADPSVWRVPDFPLHCDWALASGPVIIDSFGGHQPAGLSMVGEAPVLAFRLEKFATDETGRILACRTTRDMAVGTFKFRDLGEKLAKGFDRPDRVFALEGELPAAGRAAR